MTTWLFIGRLNPPHIWHITIIDKALKENDVVFLLIWTKEKKNEKNPLKFIEIVDILALKYANNFSLGIFELEDKETDDEWAEEVYEILLKYWDDEIYDINFYWWDFANDTAYKLRNYEFYDFDINYIEVPRKNSFVEFEWKKYEISGTNLRKALREWNLELAKKFCDKKMFEKIADYFIKER
jgi:nicotinamide mononucleotide adenylyltransferase